MLVHGVTGPGRPIQKRYTQMMLSEQDKTRAAAKLADDQIGFYVHAAVYLLVIAILVAINVLSGENWWAQWPALGWGVGLLGHGLAVFGHTPRAIAEWRLRRINRLRSNL